MGPTDVQDQTYVIPLKFVAAATVLCPAFHHPRTVFNLHISRPGYEHCRIYPNTQGSRREGRGTGKKNRIKNRHQQLKTPPYPRLTFAFLWQQTVLDGLRLQSDRCWARRVNKAGGREETAKFSVSLILMQKLPYFVSLSPSYFSC